MGPFRRMLSALFGGAPPRAEDIVFERLDGPVEESGALPEAARAEVVSGVVGGGGAEVALKEGQSAVSAARSASKGGAQSRGTRSVALGELMPRIPAAWKRSVEYAPEQILELPLSARLEVGVERSLAFSLRYLAKTYPEWFRDPGPREPDPGVDLWMEYFPDPEVIAQEIPVESVAEASEERLTFSEWEGEAGAVVANRKEARETDRILRKVRLPGTQGIGEEGFDALLSGVEPAPSPEAKAVPGRLEDVAPAEVIPFAASAPRRESAPGFVPASAAEVKTSAFPEQPAKTGAGNARLRRILAAYAGAAAPAAAPAASSAPAPAPAPGAAVGEAEAVKVEVSARPPLASAAEGSGAGSVAVPSEAPSRAASVEIDRMRSGEVGARAGEGGSAVYKMRFEELGLSLSRFPEVRGFALWQEGGAQHTGDLGMDAGSQAVREKLERIFTSAVASQGGQDGFLSVTVYNARGAVSVFGGGACLVAVAHTAEGLSAQLRSWLCGWVSQPLRG